MTNTFLFARDGYACQYCRPNKRELRNREFLTRDHHPEHRKGNRLPREAGLRLWSRPMEPNHVQLVWAVRRVTPIQAKYIRMFFGDDAVPLVRADMK